MVKKHIKKLIFFTFISLFCIGVSLLIYTVNKYTLNGEQDIKSDINQCINSNETHKENAVIHKIVTLKNKNLVLFTTNTQLGGAYYTKGLNGKYTRDFVQYGGKDILFNKDIIETNQGNYFILSGKNHDIKIHYIKITLNNGDPITPKEENFILNIPKEEYFIVYYPIKTKNLEAYPTKITLLDKENKVISNKSS